MDFSFKEHYDVNDLVMIVKQLRAPDGCPWDKVQTHESIRSEFIEEVYEAIEAIDEKDSEHLREELGDVLLQVVFHCVLETEQHHFTLDDVADDVCKKMILRHPHVFGNVSAETPEEVLKNWDAIKMQSKSQTSASETMESVSKTLPSLMRSEKIWKKAGRGGFFLPDPVSAISMARQQLNELQTIAARGDGEAYTKKVGELFFLLVGVSSFFKTDCERALYDACDDFIARFKHLEAYAAEQGIEIQKTGSEDLIALWNDLSNH